MSKKNIKVFISSTFSDLDKERDYLVRVVFPRIRERLNGVTVSEVDLRWGITDEESREKRVLDLCLQYLSESHPFFIGILGDRYGSVLSERNIVLSSNVEDTYPDVRQDIQHDLSVTEIEIQNGVLRVPDEKRPKAIFFIKETSQPYVGEDDAKFRKLQALKKRIKEQSVYPVYALNDLDDLDKAEDFIMDALRDEVVNPSSFSNSPSDSLLWQTIARDWKAHQDCLSVYREHTPASYRVLDQLMPVIERAQPLAILEGMSGVGKSTLVAQLGENYTNSKRLFIHLYGNVPHIPLDGFTFSCLFLHAAKTIFQREYNETSKRKDVSGWFTRVFKYVNYNILNELLGEIKKRKWCFVLDNTNTLRFQVISPMRYIIQAIQDAMNGLGKQYGIKVDYRILLVQSPDSPYSMPGDRYEKVKIPFGSVVDSRLFVSEYLQQYTKHLTAEQLQALSQSNLAGHIESLKMVCEYMRESVSHEQISDFIHRIRSFDTPKETYNLFIQRMRTESDEAGIRRVAGLISLFSYGMTVQHLQGLSKMSSIDFYRIWTGFSKLTVEEPSGAIHWINTQVGYVMDEVFHLNDEAFRQLLAKEANTYFFEIVNNLYTPEKLRSEIKKAWWHWKGTLIGSAPPEAYEKISGHRSDDMYVYSVLSNYKCFSYEHIRTKVYPSVKASRVTQETQMVLRKAREAAKANGGKTDFASIVAETRKYYTDDFYKFLSRYRMPTTIELCSYIEALRISKNWKQLEVELANPEVLNYIWDTSVIADNWHAAMRDASISLIQPDMRNYDKMYTISAILRNAEGMDYYRQPGQ